MLAFNQHIALVRELSGYLQNADVQEEDPGLRMCAVDFVFLGLEARVELDGIDICKVAWWAIIWFELAGWGGPRDV